MNNKRKLSQHCSLTQTPTVYRKLTRELRIGTARKSGNESQPVKIKNYLNEQKRSNFKQIIDRKSLKKLEIMDNELFETKITRKKQIQEEN